MLASAFETFSPDDGSAVAIALSQGHHKGNTSLVYCLEVLGNDTCTVIGNVFPLHNERGLYIWTNDQLRKEGLQRGSVIAFQRKQISGSSIHYYRGTTRKILDVNLVLRQLQFGTNVYNAVAYRGITEGFPNAQIADTGIYQDGPGCALISVKEAKLVDGRIFFKTRQDDNYCNLKNNCQNTRFSGVGEVVLHVPVQAAVSDQHVGSVILVSFGNKPIANGRYQGVCEAILLETHELQSYKMTSRPRGKCIIINNVNFQKKSDDRFGAVFDEEKLKILFEELFFIVDIRKDLSWDKMWDVAREVAAQDHSKFDALFFIVMSHGGLGDTILGVDGEGISVSKLMSAFKPIHCPTLENKPKVFIVQACRGWYTELTAPMHDSTLASGTSPQEGDFLLSFASAPGYTSCRLFSGSLFIQILVDVIRKHHHRSHLIEMLSEVTRQVITKSREVEVVYKTSLVQVPIDSKSLRFKLYL